MSKTDTTLNDKWWLLGFSVFVVIPNALLWITAIGVAFQKTLAGAFTTSPWLANVTGLPLHEILR